ncbi:MAG: ATP synthase F1 subunit epsilon [Chloroflexota bacterium]|nr:ATP synthase F1 subunit epsilon [Chloroflexota bacterium]
MAQRALLHVTIITAQRGVFDGDAEQVIAPGSDGQMTILPRHAPLLTTLDLGEMRVRERGEDVSIFVAGGFLEVNDNVVTVLADEAERAEDIDEEAAEAARRRAQLRVEQAGDHGAEASAIAELDRAVGRLRVAELNRQRGGRRRAPTPEDQLLQ